MRTIWQSLLWKEWHEHKWKLAALTAILLTISLACLIARPYEFYHGGMGGVLFPYAFLAGMFLAMSIAAGENARRTMPFLQSLPVPLWRAALAKLCLASLTLVVPLLLFVGMLYAVELVVPGHRELYQRAFEGHSFGDWLAMFAVGSTLVALSLLLWFAAAGVNRPDEIRAGAIGFLIVVGLFAAICLLHEYGLLGQAWMRTLLAAGPGGPAFIFGEHVTQRGWLANGLLLDAPWWSTVVPALLSHGCLIGWYLWRFGRPSGFSVRSLKPVSASEKEPTWLAPPRRSQFSAILWKQMRETAPLAVTAMAAILFFAVLFSRESNESFRLLRFEEVLAILSAQVGFFVTIVAGIGVFHEDLKPGIHTFWRSRPVNVHLWFWIKFLTGFAILAIVFGVPILWTQWDEPIDGWSEAWGLVMVLAYFALYCFAVAGTCIVRQPVYSAILTIGAILLFAFSPILFVDWIDWHHGNEWVFLGAVYAILIVVGTLTAWIAVCFNLGYKG